jgi:hypothetical protein
MELLPRNLTSLSKKVNEEATVKYITVGSVFLKLFL